MLETNTTNGRILIYTFVCLCYVKARTWAVSLNDTQQRRALLCAFFNNHMYIVASLFLFFPLRSCKQISRKMKQAGGEIKVAMCIFQKYRKSN